MSDTRTVVGVTRRLLGGGRGAGARAPAPGLGRRGEDWGGWTRRSGGESPRVRGAGRTAADVATWFSERRQRRSVTRARSRLRRRAPPTAARLAAPSPSPWAGVAKPDPFICARPHRRRQLS